MDNCNNTYCGSLLDKQIKKSFSNWENQQSKLKKKSNNTKKNKTKGEKELFKIFTKKITQKEKKKSSKLGSIKLNPSALALLSVKPKQGD